MLTFAFYLIIFVVPLVGYLLWRRYLRRRLGILFLIPLLVATAWITSWPIYNASIESAKDGDVIVNGFVLLGWLPSLIGCLPVIVLDAVLSFQKWLAKHR